MLSPDVVASLSNDEIRALPVYLGKRQHRVDDFFDVEGERSDELEIRGDAEQGQMDRPRHDSRPASRIVGNAGMHLGAYMKGGHDRRVRATRHGLARRARCRAGSSAFGGNAGGQVGAAYRGSPSGMTDGTIIIDGTAGLEVGMRMKRGIIAVGGMVRDFAGLQMKGGTIVLRSGAELRTGAWMMRGTIVSLKPIPLLPTFARACDVQPDIHAHVRPPPRDTGCGGPVCGDRRGLSALHGRRQCSRQGRNPGVEGVSVSPGHRVVKAAEYVLIG